jgi:hypothetical protein
MQRKPRITLLGRKRHLPQSSFGGRTAFSSLDEASRDAAMALYKKVPGFSGPAKRFTSPSISGSACAPPKRKKKTKQR